MGAPHQDIDPTEFETWLSPPDALARFPGKSVQSVRRSIAERLYQGLLRSAAKTAVFMGEDDRQSHYLIRRDHWDSWAQEYDPDFWEIGDTKVPTHSDAGYSAGYSMGNWFYGVRIDPDGLAAIAGYKPGVPTPAPTPAAASVFRSPARSAGGRPPNPYWEPLLIEMARQLFVGDLKPDRQVDIENAMNSWLVEQGHSAGETQVRERARALFKAIHS